MVEDNIDCWATAFLEWPHKWLTFDVCSGTQRITVMCAMLKPRDNLLQNGYFASRQLSDYSQYIPCTCAWFYCALFLVVILAVLCWLISVYPVEYAHDFILLCLFWSLLPVPSQCITNARQQLKISRVLFRITSRKLTQYLEIHNWSSAAV